MLRCLFARLSVGLLLMISAALLYADDADIINLQASFASTRDDNLFRVPSNGARKPVLDTISTTTFGISVNKAASLQKLVGNVSWNGTRYQNNSQLDGGGLHYDAKWLWAVGRAVTGELSADRTVAQNSFRDVQGLSTTERNQRTTESQRLAADYWLHSDWHLLGTLSRQTVSNEQAILAESNFESHGGTLGVRYFPRSGNSISWQARRSDGRYTNRASSEASQFDNAYVESGQDVSVNWRPSGKGTITGKIGYQRRRHPHFSGRDFGGWVGQLGYSYSYSAKTTLGANYQRNLAAYQQQSSSYYLSDELTLTSEWAATSQVSLAARLAWSQRYFRGEIVAVNAERKDEVKTLGVDLTYQPQRSLRLTAGLAAETRNSNDNAFDYTDRKVLLTARVQF